MSIAGSKQVAWLLHDLTVQLGYSMAARNPEQFEGLVALGPGAFANAVLIAEGLDPNFVDKAQRDALHGFVKRRFERWAAESAA